MTDFYTFKLAEKLYGDRVGYWTLLASIASFFNFFCSVRTFSNSIETSLSSIALYLWPWNVKEGYSKFKWNWRFSMLIVGLTCVMRPTNAIQWVPMGIHLLVPIKVKDALAVCLDVLCIGLFSLGFGALIDYLYYGEWILVPVNFFAVNISGDIASFYGTHPWHWYISQGIPFVTLSALPFVLWIVYSKNDSAVKVMRWVFGFSIFVYSCLGHKEFRFMMPLLPLALICAGRGLSALQIPSANKKKDGERGNSKGRKHQLSNSEYSWKGRALGFFFVLNAMAAVYFSLVHQRGVVDVMWWLRKEISTNSVDGILFLMPCHSTPLYSYLHSSIPTRFLTCEPPIE
ncbi:hypothetical protein HDU76_011178 [Blyttiomyces sp. JEL0837]|nr:hypothetical protein HDU76_011178 [Blyttiomyces sp. JEL0837]